MKKLLLLLILSFFSTQGLAASCPDGSEPVKSVSADGTYFVYSCSGSSEQANTPATNFPNISLPQDVASGNIYKKSLQDPKTFKDYGVQVVDKKDGHPVRAGSKSIRFELRNGDCGETPPYWSDCDTDRERHELSGSYMSDGEEWWYAWSIFLPKDFKNISPSLLDLGQFHGDNSWVDPCCSFMFKNYRGGYHIENLLDNYKLKKVLTQEEMSEKWNDILVNVKWSKNNNGFINLWVNNKLVYEYQGPTLTKNSKFVYFKFGVYRSRISLFLNQSKRLYNISKLPTQVVYYDEVRVGKSKEQVVGNLPLRIK